MRYSVVVESMGGNIGTKSYDGEPNGGQEDRSNMEAPTVVVTKNLEKEIKMEEMGLGSLVVKAIGCSSLENENFY